MPEKGVLQETILLERDSAKFYEIFEIEPICKQDQTILLSFEVEADKDITGILCYATDGKEPNGYMNMPIAIDAGTHQYLFELTYPGVDGICFTADRDISGETVEIRNLCISVVDSKAYYAPFMEGAKRLQAQSMRLESFRDDEIIGTVNAENEGILFFSIPYNIGWHAYVDGQEVEWLNVNVGFSGVRVNEGEHHVELRYGKS